MNFQCDYIILGLIIFVSLKPTDGKVTFSNSHPLADVRNDYYTYKKLDTPRSKLAYNLMNKSFMKRYLLKLLKNKGFLGKPKPFVDLTRDFSKPFDHGDDNRFSEDYFDISDFARYEKRPEENSEFLNNFKPKNNKVLIDIHGNTYHILKMLDQIARRSTPYRRKKTSESDSDDGDTSVSESDSEEIEPEDRKNILKTRPETHFTPKRFQVINNNSGETKSDYDDERTINVSSEPNSDVGDSDKESPVVKSSESDEASDGYIYIQSPTRHLKTKEWRRRLKHFLPKRVHWDVDEFHQLRNFWISGPRGRYPAHYKTPY